MRKDTDASRTGGHFAVYTEDLSMEISSDFYMMLGYDIKGADEIPSDHLTDPCSRLILREAVDQADKGMSSCVDLHFKKADGTALYARVLLTSCRVDCSGASRRPGKHTGYAVDITDLVSDNAALRRLAYYDSLTGFYNSQYYQNLLSQPLVKEDLPLSVIACDINGLKLINDIFGKITGDRVIQCVAQAIRSIVRENDVVMRSGGDEFCICLIRTGLREAEKACEAIAAFVASPMDFSFPESLSVSLSFGAITLSSSDQSYNEGFCQAETLLNKHKLLETKSYRSSTVSLMLQTLQEKNIETSDHFDRMKDHCLSIGRHLGLSASELTDLELLAVLHDIGKIAINDQIINKNAKLTKQEKEEIKKHSEYGFRITQSVTEFQHLSEYILAHHEKWDGTGYPNQLSGQDIPLLSRILTLADSFDAMTHVRPYREALSNEAAIAELLNCSGTQFDPDITELFIRKVLAPSLPFAPL